MKTMTWNTGKKLISLPFILSALVLLPLQTASAATMKQFVVTMEKASGERISTSQLTASENSNKNSIETKHGVSILEEFRSPELWIQSFSAEGIEDLEAYLAELQVEPDSIIESSFIHTPESVGGPKAGAVRAGHKIYMIERDIPGAGSLPQEMRDKIALGSQGTIEKIGDGIEWDHSYVTSEGTYCVYRANDPALIQEHATMMEVPANPITQVEHIVRGFDFSKTTM